MVLNAPLLVLGTHNRKKGAELVELLAPLGFEIHTLANYSDSIDVIEDGDSFASNAAKKAVQQAQHLGVWVLGEDSGLCVDALDGAPGIYSARFAGPQATDTANNRHLLELLSALPLAKRTARYVCHMTVSDPDGRICAESEAYCRGRIRGEPVGTHGFGYDPLFEIVEYRRTFGQLGPAAKAAISHRVRATNAIGPQLRGLLRHGQWADIGNKDDHR